MQKSMHGETKICVQVSSSGVCRKVDACMFRSCEDQTFRTHSLKESTFVKRDIRILVYQIVHERIEVLSVEFFFDWAITVRVHPARILF
jgi:hypothetical protein